MKRSLMVLALIAFAFSTFVVGRLLAANEFNPTTTIKFGEVFVEQNEYAEDLLGDLVIAPQAGHDGKFFFSQAMDPFYLEEDAHARYLDRPTYRAQRMAYPTLSSLGGLLPAQATAWGLILVNIAAMVAGTVYTGLVALRMGVSWLFGLAFLLNPGLIVDLSIDGAGVVAMAAMMAGVYYALEDAMWPAAIALSVASLARETMLIAVGGLAAYLWYRNRRIPWSMGLPVASVAAWWVYVHWRLSEGLTQDTQALDLPFKGFFEAFQTWVGTPGSLVDALVGCVLLVVSILIVIRAVRSPTHLGWAVAGFAMLGILMSEPVWENWFDSSRALAPVLTAYLILVPALGVPSRPLPRVEASAKH
jgi:hypothetical protein